MRALSEILAGAGATAIVCAAITWGATPGVPQVTVGYLGAGVLAAALSLAIDGRRA